VFTSPTKHYRHKCRFAIHRLDCLPADPNADADADIDADADADAGSPLGYFLYDHGTASVPVTQYPIASLEINAAMPVLLALLQADPVLRTGIRAATLLSTTRGALCVTLIYATDIGSAPGAGAWEAAAAGVRGQLRDALRQARRARVASEQTGDGGDGGEEGEEGDIYACGGEGGSSGGGGGVTVVGRSKGVRLLLGEEFVTERLRLVSGRALTYRQHIDGFSNPNPYVNTKCLDWLGEVFLAMDQACSLSSCNLLEMYCGNGNHTVAISQYFRHAVLVELNPVLCECAAANMKL
jgi:tRNA (uracil-5-)-methyltransferase